MVHIYKVLCCETLDIPFVNLIPAYLTSHQPTIPKGAQENLLHPCSTKKIVKTGIFSKSQWLAEIFQMISNSIPCTIKIELYLHRKLRTISLQRFHAICGKISMQLKLTVSFVLRRYFNLSIVLCLRFSPFADDLPFTTRLRRRKDFKL
ncbi:hypothetical protein Avbf_10197 [Armadillidium vulgare]|nr:hypothetical protein Avbf_10197 [Armadillidium vulgare]